MKCPIDQTEMEKGILASGGSGWMKMGIRVGVQMAGLGLFGAEKVYTYKCPKCGKLELITETELNKKGE